MLIIDSRMREIEKNKLKSLGYELYEIPINHNLYSEISAHPDIHATVIKNTLFSCINIPDCIYCETKLKNKYPNDVYFNICNIGNNVIHNFKHTNKTILEFIDNNNINKIMINQGYSKCSIAVIDDNSAIVTDSKIAEALKQNNIDVLLIPEEITKSIHLLKEDLSYSNMTGFIGGVISRIDNSIFISGDLKLIDPNNQIRNFIESKNLTIIDFPGLDIIDYGGIIEY